MALYSYKAINKTGKEVKSTVTSESVATAKQKIKASGLMLLSIKEKKASNKDSNAISFGSGVPVEDLAIMTRQLATLIKAKIQLVEALSGLMEQIENNTLRMILADLKQKVNEGQTLSSSLANYPKVFNTVYCNMVEAGEASGNLDVVLLRLAEFTETQVKLKNKIQGAMMYPLIMAIFGFIMMNVIFIFVIPKMAKIFESMKKELPLPTKISINISHYLQDYWWLNIIVFVVGFYLFRKYIQTKGGKSKWHLFQLKALVFGKLTKMINVSRFCSTLATLLNSGVPILVSLRIVKNLLPNIHLQKTIDQASDAVKEGASLAQPLIDSGHFPPLVTHMIKLGEKSGEMEDMLNIVAENYSEQVDSKIASLTAALEPLMMVGMGLAVGFIVVSVIVPMMEMSKM